MPWKKTGIILGSKFTRGGLDKPIAAGMVCREAERLYPGLFKAVSVKNGVLTLAVPIAETMQIKMIEGPLVTALEGYSLLHKLPLVERVKLIPELQD